MKTKEDAKQIDAEMLETREVFIDTEVYRSEGYDLTKPFMIALTQQVSADRLKLHVSDITLAESRRHIMLNAKQGLERVKAAQNAIRKWAGKAPESVNKPSKQKKKLDASKMGGEMYAIFQSGLPYEHLHRASEQSASTILADYFNRRAPFDATDGKSVKEFPDAFVIAALDNWCTDNDAKMYVLTKDRAMQRAVADRPNLIPLSGLAPLLELAAKDQSPGITDAVDEIIETEVFPESLGEAFDECIGDLVVIYHGDLADGEVHEFTRAGTPEIYDWTAISSNDDGFGIIVDFRVNLLVEVEYEDRSLAMYDREDGVYIGAENAMGQIEDEVELRIFLEVDQQSSIKRAELRTPEVYVSDEIDYY